MTIDSITTVTATVGAALLRVASRAVLSLTRAIFVVLAWIALAFVGAWMLVRWSWKPVRRSAVAVASVVMSVRP